MEFCTVFDKSYLSKALTLYRSIEKMGIKTHALCLDSESYHKVKSLCIENFTPYYLLDIEKDDPDLLILKTKETKSMFGDQYSRYVWALTPYFCNYILNKTNSEELIYIDSDIYFYAGIEEIVKEVEGYSVGIVTHRTLHHINNETDSGKYNVGIVYFRKDQYGLDCSSFWKSLLMDPDNQYSEKYGKCGDQKYLELFEIKFPQKVKVIDDLVGHGAPWCFHSYTYLEKYKISWLDKIQPLIFNHFSHFTNDINSWSSSYKGEWFPENVNNFVREYYEDYHQEINKTIKIFDL